MCDQCDGPIGNIDFRGFPVECILLTSGFAIDRAPDGFEGPKADKPITAIAFTGQFTPSEGVFVDSAVMLMMDLCGLAQVKAQIERYVSKLDPTERAKFVHLYDQAGVRVRDQLKDDQ